MQQLLTGWNFRRILYITLGAFVAVSGIVKHEWLGVVAGGYFVVMAVFKLGCLSGNCVYTPPKKEDAQ